MTTIEEPNSAKSGKSSEGSVTSFTTETNSPIAKASRKQSEMEEAINHLANMREKRDEELQNLKKTIRDCKAQMAELLGEVPASPRFSVSCTPCSHEINWKQPGVWKLLGGALLMLYLLSTNLCYTILPRFPRFYSFIFFTQLMFHLFLTAIAPLMIRLGGSLGLLTDNATTFYDNHIQEHKNSISAVSNAAAIIFLKLKRCSYGCGCGSCVQLLITFCLFIAELAAACDDNLPYVNGNSKFDYYVTFAILLNLSLTLLS